MPPFYESIGGKPTVLVDGDYLGITFKIDTQSSVRVKVDGWKRVKLSMIGSVATSEVIGDKKTRISSPDKSINKVGSIVVSESDFIVESLNSGEVRNFVYHKNPIKI